jgi:hypothetical protein
VPIRYSDRELLEMLQDYADLFGRPPTQSAINKHPDYPSASTFVRRFGSWNNAIREAGLIPREGKGVSYTDEQLLDFLKELHKELGRLPTNSDLRSNPHYPVPTTYRTRFGSLVNALELAGLGTRPEHHRYSDEELLDAIRMAKEIYGRVPGSSEWPVLCDGFPSITTYYRRFKRPWREIVKMAFDKKGKSR